MPYFKWSCVKTGVYHYTLSSVVWEHQNILREVSWMRNESLSVNVFFKSLVVYFLTALSYNMRLSESVLL